MSGPLSFGIEELAAKLSAHAAKAG
jgi:hypothetical protein